MLDKFKKVDAFTKNIILVFAGTSLANFLNLIYQLLIAHKLSPADFAAFNALLSVFVILTSPLSTIQMAVAKYSAEFNAHSQKDKVKSLLSGLLKNVLILAFLTFLVFWLVSPQITKSLKIYSVSSGYILALLLALSWLSPVFLGGVQGLEFFGWMTGSSVASGILKLILAYLFILLGYGISGALGALLISSFFAFFICYIPLKRYISFSFKDEIDYRELFVYLFPVAISIFCMTGLVNMDMVLVKKYFIPEEAGLYSLAQIVGKIFLFLPAAVSMVMFPRASALNAKNMDTVSTLNKSLAYVAGLSILAAACYNLFPGMILRIITGKAYPESIFLGRIFSISMSFFAFVNVLIFYFLSIKDLRFIKYLFIFTVLQFLAIFLFHPNLSGVQIVLCINSALLFFVHLALVYKKQKIAEL